MTDTISPPAYRPVYRIDSFAVPSAALKDLRAIIVRTHAVLHQQPGFVHDQYFEQVSGPGRFNVITLVKWQGADDLANAARAIQALHASLGFDAAAFLSEHAIESSRANYHDQPLAA